MCSLWINPMILVAEKVFVHWKKLFKKISGLVSYNVNPHVCKNQTFLQRKVYIVWTLISLKQFFSCLLFFGVFFCIFSTNSILVSLVEKNSKKQISFWKDWMKVWVKILWNYFQRETRPHIGNPLLLHKPENYKLFLIIYVTHFNPR